MEELQKKYTQCQEKLESLQQELEQKTAEVGLSRPCLLHIKLLENIICKVSTEVNVRANVEQLGGSSERWLSLHAWLLI